MLGYNRKPLNVDREEAGNESSPCEVLGTVGILSSQHLSILELSLLGPHGSGRTSSPMLLSSPWMGPNSSRI